MAADICGPIGSPGPACSVCERCKAEVLLAEAAARESALREDISRYVARDTERLAEVEKLREALEPFAEADERIQESWKEMYDDLEDNLSLDSQELAEVDAAEEITLADLRRARAALAEGNSNG